MKYTTKTTNIENKPGCWNSLLVEIFQDDVKVGEYTRNYHTLYDTFHPFELNGKDYALYSRDYTSTRIMSLPDCQDIGGEERDTWGFCPTQYFVPSICIHWPPESPEDPKPLVANHNAKKWATLVPENGHTRYYWPDDKKNPNYSEEREREYIAERDLSHKLSSEWLKRHPFTEMSANFGFVSGCVWGDDSSWKIQYLDLSGIEKGVIKRDDRFGYIELPENVKLKDAISTSCFDADYPYIEIAVAQRFNINGKKADDD